MDGWRFLCFIEITRKFIFQKENIHDKSRRRASFSQRTSQAVGIQRNFSRGNKNNSERYLEEGRYDKCTWRRCSDKNKTTYIIIVLPCAPLNVQRIVSSRNREVLTRKLERFTQIFLLPVSLKKKRTLENVYFCAISKCSTVTYYGEQVFS